MIRGIRREIWRPLATGIRIFRAADFTVSLRCALMEIIKKYLTALKNIALAALLLVVTTLLIIGTISVIHFPYDVDAPLRQHELEAARKYYTEAYQQPVTESQGRS